MDQAERSMMSGFKVDMIRRHKRQQQQQLQGGRSAGGQAASVLKDIKSGDLSASLMKVFTTNRAKQQEHHLEVRPAS